MHLKNWGNEKYGADNEEPVAQRELEGIETQVRVYKV